MQNHKEDWLSSICHICPCEISAKTWSSLKLSQKPTLSPTVALKVSNGACLQLFNTILHWLPRLSAKPGLEKAFPPALLRSGVLFLGDCWCTAVDQAVLLQPHSRFIPVVALTGWETTSLPLLSLLLPFLPLPWMSVDGSDYGATRKAVFVVKGQSSSTSIYISKHEQSFPSLRNQFPQHISQSCFNRLN